MHSSRMRTGRTLTVFRKFGEPPPEKLETPQKIGDTPPENWRPPQNWRHPPGPGPDTPPPMKRMNDRHL